MDSRYIAHASMVAANSFDSLSELHLLIPSLLRDIVFSLSFTGLVLQAEALLRAVALLIQQHNASDIVATVIDC